MTKRYLISLMLLIFFIAFTQKKNNIEFEKISFIQKDSITSLEEYKKGEQEALEKFESKMNPLMDGLMESLGGKAGIKEKDKKFSDSLINSTSQKELDKFIKVYHYGYVDKNIWKRWETKENNDILTYPVFIDFSKGKEYYDYPYNGIEEYPYIFEKIKNLKIQEFRKEKKTINGIECFKIKCFYSQINEYEKMDGMPEFSNEVDQIDSEMWVTEKIKSIYHPAFKVKEILEKYYLLDIIEKNSSIQGMIRKVTLKKVN